MFAFSFVAGKEDASVKCCPLALHDSYIECVHASLNVCVHACVRWKTLTPPAFLRGGKNKVKRPLIELLYIPRTNVAADTDPWLSSKVTPLPPL